MVSSVTTGSILGFVPKNMLNPFAESENSAVCTFEDIFKEVLKSGGDFAFTMTQLLMADKDHNRELNKKEYEKFYNNCSYYA